MNPPPTAANIEPSTASVEFSPTGGHSAYVGRRGNDFIAVVDGKEAVTPTTVSAIQTYGTARGLGFTFNRDASRLAYGAMTGPGAWVMVVDGVKSAAYRAIDFTQTALNGKRLVYVAQTGDKSGVRSSTAHRGRLTPPFHR
jgi:hypothetical protein